MDIVISQDFFPQVGGAHLWIYEVYRRWPKPVELLTVNSEVGHEDFDRLDHGSLAISRVNQAIGDINLADPACLGKILGNIKNITRRVGHDIPYVHCMRAFPEGIFGLAYKLFLNRSAKLVVYAHGEETMIARSSQQLRWIAGAVYAASDLVIANSENTRKLVTALCSRTNIVRIHPGVDPAAFAFQPEKRTTYRVELGWPENTFIVCTMARMEPRKNHAAVIRAIASLIGDGYTIGYLCGSDGEEMTNLAELAGNLGIREWVRFTGFIGESEKQRVYAASDVYAMPSIVVGEMIEGFGIVFLEAAAAGIPAIAGNTGGQAEAVRDGITGLVVDGTHDWEIKAALRRFIEDATLRSRMGNNGIAWATANAWDCVSDKIFREVYGHA